MPTLSAEQIRPHLLKVAGFQRLCVHETRSSKTQYVVTVTIGVAFQFREGDIGRIQCEKQNSFPGLVGKHRLKSSCVVAGRRGDTDILQIYTIFLVECGSQTRKRFNIVLA